MGSRRLWYKDGTVHATSTLTIVTFYKTIAGGSRDMLLFHVHVAILCKTFYLTTVKESWHACDRGVTAWKLESDQLEYSASEVSSILRVY